MLIGALLFSSVICLLSAFAADQSRGQDGLLTRGGRFWTLFALVILLAWVFAGCWMWSDPDRLREGDDYWVFAVPVFLIGGFVLASLLMSLWWGLRALMRTGWIPALLAALPVWYMTDWRGAIFAGIPFLLAELAFRWPRLRRHHTST
ncbi:MAG: hypothetical protein K0R39_3522 [Symbiobacteriaceae bacterium]|jgi:hypothetical protein|nr:hypothetical protein [Symbiobacteriaceae bacterium]